MNEQIVDNIPGTYSAKNYTCKHCGGKLEKQNKRKSDILPPPTLKLRGRGFL